MLNILGALAGVLAMLVVSEYLWRRRPLHPEVNRKFVHIGVGTFVAFWPYFLGWNDIRFLSLAFLVVVLASQKFKLFKTIHSVQRPTWGEIFFALIVGLLTFVTHSRGLYAAALLQMSLADGLAAVTGTIYGQKTHYRVLGTGKSALGTLTFALMSLAILLIYLWVGGQGSVWTMIGLAAASTLLENIAVRGLDNLAIPLLVALALR